VADYFVWEVLHAMWFARSACRAAASSGAAIRARAFDDCALWRRSGQCSGSGFDQGEVVQGGRLAVLTRLDHLKPKNRNELEIAYHHAAFEKEPFFGLAFPLDVLQVYRRIHMQVFPSEYV
jgi:hypothetical protein